MAALVETMFSVRQTPWHGLGTIVEEAPDSKEAIRLAGLDWKVESKPIYDASGRMINGFYANTRNSDDSVLGIVSTKYKIVQNDEAFSFTDSLIGADVKYETAGSLRNGKQIWLLAKMPETKILDDTVEPYICFTNTFDGSGAIRVCMTNTRVVCNNTLNLALNTAKRSWSTKHMGDMASKLAEAKETLKLAQKYNVALNEEAIKLANKIITDAELNDIIDSVFKVDLQNDSQRKINNAEFSKSEILRCYNMPDIEKFKGTGWGVVNAVSDFVCHSQPTRLTKSYQENNWGKIINGHPIFDDIYSKVLAI